MTQEHGLAIDASFLDQFQDPKLWFLELITDTETRSQLQAMARAAASTAEQSSSSSSEFDLGVHEAFQNHFINVMQH